MNNGYKLRFATESRALFYKPFDTLINQVVLLFVKTGNTKALVELRAPNEYISQDTINMLQIALNRARKDSREYYEDFKKEIKKIYE